MRGFVLIVTLLSLLLYGVPVQAADAQPPGQKQSRYVRWYYPSQMAYGPVETGLADTGSPAARGAFLTLPFMGPHIVTSLFDHCYPNYVVNGRVCRYDGTVATASQGGPDPTFTEGYAQTPAGHDFLYYDGHDGYDYALTYEPIAAAAPGTVYWADWLDPNCHTCLSGLTVEITHGNGLLTFYGHMSQIYVRKGQQVRRGQVIGISGSTGTATGPHLHFGVYVANSGVPTPVDPFGWSGGYPDPYAYDRADLWQGGSPRFAPITMPHVSASAVPDPNDSSAIDVSWSSPGDGTVFDVYTVRPNGSMAGLKTGVGAGSAVFQGKPGKSYWFWVSVTTDLGWKDAGGSAAVKLPIVNREKAQ